jgi:phosphate uptake regulator
MTLPAEWAGEQGVEKGDEVSLRFGGKGTLTVLPESVQTEDSEAVIHAVDLNAAAVERAIVAQYVLGRRVIHVEAPEGETLASEIINAVYNAETQLMGLGVIEETVSLVPLDEAGRPLAFIETRDEVIRAWAEDELDAYRAQAERLESTDAASVTFTL